MRDFAGKQVDLWLRARAAEVVLALALAPAFAWMSPFMSDEQPFLRLLGYWSGLLASWFMLMAIVERLLSALDVVRRMPPALRQTTIIAVAAVPMILIAGSATYILKGWKITPYEVAETYVQIIMIGSGVALIAIAIFSPRFQASPPAGETMPSPVMRDPLSEEASNPVARGQNARRSGMPGADNRLIGRLPPHLRGRILCLEMEDHYVRVHTDRGSALVLLRLSDAIAEAETVVSGRQVHRSWWAASEAIERFERIGRTGQLHLKGGLKAPVSHRYLKVVESAYASNDASHGATRNPQKISAKAMMPVGAEE